MNNLKILFVYGYGYPDENVSSMHFTQFAEELAKNGINCDFWCNNHPRWGDGKVFPQFEKLRGINFWRVKNIPLKGSKIRRIFNIIIFNFVIFFRLLLVNRKNKFDYVITGTDPMFNHVAVSLALMISRRKTEHLHWLLDLYPQALLAANILSAKNIIYRMLNLVSNLSYSRMDKIYVLDDAMAKHLPSEFREKVEYLFPWSLMSDDEIIVSEDRIQKVRKKEQTQDKLTILMSGNFGFAHISKNIFSLLKELALSPEIILIVSVAGSQSKTLYGFLDDNKLNYIRKDFVPLSELPLHLTASDMHVTIIGEDWGGIVVPSKFFGSLQLGKPTIYVGPAGTLIADWIANYGVGVRYVGEGQNFASFLAQFDSSMLKEYGENSRKLYSQKVDKVNQISKIISQLRLKSGQ